MPNTTKANIASSAKQPASSRYSNRTKETINNRSKNASMAFKGNKAIPSGVKERIGKPVISNNSTAVAKEKSSIHSAQKLADNVANTEMKNDTQKSLKGPIASRYKGVVMKRAKESTEAKKIASQISILSLFIEDGYEFALKAALKDEEVFLNEIKTLTSKQLDERMEDLSNKLEKLSLKAYFS